MSSAVGCNPDKAVRRIRAAISATRETMRDPKAPIYLGIGTWGAIDTLFNPRHGWTNYQDDGMRAWVAAVKLRNAKAAA